MPLVPLTLRSHQRRAIDALIKAAFGQVVIPTGGGKTLVMILDAVRRLQESTSPQTIVVIAPRILLANQLSEEFLEHISDAEVMHVHSGETHHFSSTKIAEIQTHSVLCKAAEKHQLIFTTYNSLRRINEAGIHIDVAYFDEAHNATRRHFFEEVANCNAKNYYYFTATPKHSVNPLGRGMNNRLVFGPVLESVPAPELIANGSIVSPTVLTHTIDLERQKGLFAAENDRDTLLNIIDDLDPESASKVLVAAPNTRVLWRMLSSTNVIAQFHERGYDVMHITAKHGAYINKTKVSREVFFDTLTAWGKDPNRKFIMFHYSILSEGINVPGLTHCILLRQLPIVEMAQTIGRVIRMDPDDAADIAAGKIPAGSFGLYRKRTGFVTVPIYSNHGKGIAKRLQDVVDCIFVKGIPAIATV
jgi:superfamily II DNA or RNA helicase